MYDGQNDGGQEGGGGNQEKHQGQTTQHDGGCQQASGGKCMPLFHIHSFTIAEAYDLFACTFLCVFKS